jgi:hypothetical protein
LPISLMVEATTVVTAAKTNDANCHLRHACWRVQAPTVALWLGTTEQHTGAPPPTRDASDVGVLYVRG